MTKTEERALNLARLYLGSEGIPIRSQQRIYDRLQKAITTIASKNNADPTEVFEACMAAAKRRGAIRPMPGKDY